MFSALAVTALVLASGAGAARSPLRGNSPIEGEEKLTAASEAHALFGYSVAISADGNTALVGAPGDRNHTGSAWVFVRSGPGWVQQGPPLTIEAGAVPEMTTPECEEGEHEELHECGFGGSVALSADGNTALIGGAALNGVGGAWVFTRTGSTWTQQGDELTGGEEIGDGRFGRSVALSADGNTALIGGPRDRRGAAWVFARAGSDWTQQGAKLTALDGSGDSRFGRSVALSADGNTALIGGPGDGGRSGAVWVFGRSGSSWTQQGAKLAGGEEIGEGAFGDSVALSADAGTALVGGAADGGYLGAAWAFTRSASGFAQQGPKLTGTGESGAAKFGDSVALSAHGQRALVGGPADDEHLGAAWSFTRAGAGFSAEGPKLVSGFGGRRVGTDVALSGDAGSALVGAPGDAGNLGAVWAFGETPETAPSPPPVGMPPTNAPLTTVTDEVLPTGGSPTAHSGVLGASAAAPPVPVLGVTGNLAPVSGSVLIKLPGSSDFVPLTGIRQVPFGTIVDARHGKVVITTIGPHGGSQTITLYEGEFELTQSRNGVVTATLVGGNFASCLRRRSRGHRALAASRHKRPVRKLWAEGHGSYSTKGNYATGSVLGTRWLTEDLCEGTLIVVATDKVSVTNLVTHHHLTVRAGHSYLAKAP